MRVPLLSLCLALILKNSSGTKYDEELCGIGWKSYKDFCYTIQASSKTWSQSRDDCVSRNAQLVKLTTLDELNYVYNTFIRPLHGQSAWIGLSKKDGRFQWQDGSNVTFSNWNTAKVMVHPENMVMASISNVDFALLDHIIQKINAIDVMQCSSHCFVEPNCFSINYKHEDNLCELNNSTKAVSKPESFVQRPGFIYYD